MVLATTTDVARYDAIAGDFLRSRPVENTVLVTVLEALRARGSAAYGDTPAVLGSWRPAAGRVDGARGARHGLRRPLAGGDRHRPHDLGAPPALPARPDPPGGGARPPPPRPAGRPSPAAGEVTLRRTGDPRTPRR